MKKFLSLLLVFVMVMSIVLVSCTDKNNDGENGDKEGNNTKSAVEVIADALSELKLASLLDGTSSVSTNLIKDLSLDGKYSSEVKYDSETRKESAEFIVKDGYLKAEVDGETGWMKIADDGVYMFHTDANGNFVFDDFDAVQTMGTIEDMKEMVKDELGVSDSDLNSILNTTLPKIEESDLEEKNGYWYFTDAYYTKFAQSLSDGLSTVLKMAGMNMTNADKAGAEALIKDLIDTANLEIGLAVENNYICGIALGVECDIMELAGVAMNNSEMIAAADGTYTVKGQVRISKNEIFCDVTVNMGGTKVVVKANSEAATKDSMTGFKVTGSYTMIQDGDEFEIGANAELYWNYNAENGKITKAEGTLSVTRAGNADDAMTAYFTFNGNKLTAGYEMPGNYSNKADIELNFNSNKDLGAMPTVIENFVITDAQNDRLSDIQDALMMWNNYNNYEYENGVVVCYKYEELGLYIYYGHIYELGIDYWYDATTSAPDKYVTEEVEVVTLTDDQIQQYIDMYNSEHGSY